MKDKKNTKIQKEIVEIGKHESRMQKQKEKIRCKCTHIKSQGDYSLVRDRNSNNPRAYKCTQCGKSIDITRLEDKDIDFAIDVIDKMCDIIKMTVSSSNKESDMEFLEKISNCQFRVRNDLKQYYNISLKAQKDRRSSRSDRSERTGSSQWGAPENYR